MTCRTACRIAIMALLLLSSLPMIENASYTERITAQTFDQNFRPVEGVEVYADYVLNSVNTNVRTKSRFTNSSGMVDFSFTNYEEIENSTSSDYTVYFKYGTQLQFYHLISNRDNKTRLVSGTNITAYRLQVKVHDQNSLPLVARLTIGNNRTKIADSTGYAMFQLPPGNYTLRAEIADAIKSKNAFLDQDRAIDVEIGLYPLEVYVSDDKHSPLVATVMAGGKENKTDANGRVKFVNISDESVQVVVQSNDSVKKFPVDLASQSRLDVVFDRTRPLIKELHVTPMKTGAASIRLYIEDPGDSASGIDTVIVTYEVEGVENQVPAYSIGYNTYEVKIPIQPPKTLVKYVVKVTDREGNGAFETGDYVVGGEEGGTDIPVEPIAPGQVQIGFLKGGTETMVIIAAAVCLLLFGAYYYMKNKRDNSFVPPSAKTPPKIPGS